MTELAKTNFIKPRPFDELKGELGLTAEDIAKGLGVPLENVHKKLNRGKWYKCSKWQIIPYGMINKNNVSTTSYILSMRAAKAFVARW